MMTFTGSRDSCKSLPADMQAAFQPRTYVDPGLVRLQNNARVVQQSGGMYGMGIGYLGDTCVDDNGNTYDCSDLPDPTATGITDTTTGLPYLQDSTPLYTSGETGDSVFSNMTAAQQAQFESATAAQQTSMLASLGVPAAQIATVLAAAGTAAQKALLASQGISTNAAGVPVSTLQSTLGISGGTLALIAVGFLAVMVMGRGK